MYEANLSEMARMLIKERLALAEQVRLTRTARRRCEVRKTLRADASRAACRGSEQRAY